MLIKLISQSAETFKKNDRVIARIGKDQWYTGTVSQGGESVTVVFDRITKEAMEIENKAMEQFKGLTDAEKREVVDLLKAAGEDGPEIFWSPKYVPDKPGVLTATIEGKDLKWLKKIPTKQQFHHRLSNDAAKKIMEIPSYKDFYEELKVRQALAVKKLRSTPIINEFAPGLYYKLGELLKGKCEIVQPSQLADPDRQRAWRIDPQWVSPITTTLLDEMKKLGWTRDQSGAADTIVWYKNTDDTVPGTTVKVKSPATVILERLGSSTKRYAKLIINVDKVNPENQIPIVMPIIKQGPTKVTITPSPTIDSLVEGTTRLVSLDTVHGHIDKDEIVDVVKIGKDRDRVQVKTDDGKLVIIKATELKYFREV